jgi:hypothetical protein
MTTPRWYLLALVSGLLAAAGCQSPSAPASPQDTTKYTVESTEKFAIAERDSRLDVTCTGLQEHLTADGRLEVAANIKNRENRRIQLQTTCVFKDEQGFVTEDEAPWQALDIAENATEVKRFTSANAKAHRYTVLVRTAR